MELRAGARVRGVGRCYRRWLFACCWNWPWVKTLAMQKREGQPTVTRSSQLSPEGAGRGHGGLLLLGEEGEDGGL